MAESPDGERPGALPCQLLDHGTGYLCAAAALQALARQSARGGTQFRELALARTAHWLLGLPGARRPGLRLAGGTTTDVADHAGQRRRAGDHRAAARPARRRGAGLAAVAQPVRR